MEGFPYVHREQVRFRDLDAMGHVNNAVFLTYLEQARFAFLHGLGLVSTLQLPEMILARIELDYRAPLGAGGDAEIGVRPGRVGSKSFELEHRIESSGRHVADAHSVLVAFDYERQESIELAEKWRAALAPETVHV